LDLGLVELYLWTWLFQTRHGTALTASGQYRNTGSIYMAFLAGGVLEASKGIHAH
jgi:hypothetical protein